MKCIAVTILLLFLMACAVQTETPAEKEDLQKQIVQDIVEVTEEPVSQPQISEPEEVTVSEENVTTKVKETIPTETHEEEITAPAQPRTRLYDYLDKFAQTVTGYSFKYGVNSYFSRGTKYKVILNNAVSAKDVMFGEEKKSLFYYDTVYIDRGSKTAIAYCEGHKSAVNSQCDSLELYDLALPVPYESYMIKLPEDWLFEYLDTEPILVDKNKNYIKNRVATLIRFSNGEIIDLNVDELIGLPLRVDIKKGDALIKRYEYEDLVSNKVSVIHRSKSEIPTEEAFY